MTEQWPHSTGYTPTPAAPVRPVDEDVYGDVPSRVADDYGPVPVSPGPHHRSVRRPAPTPTAMQVTPADLPTVGERALAVVKDLIVIVTCLVLLYSVWRGYVFLDRLGEGLKEMGDTWSQIGQ